MPRAAKQLILALDTEATGLDLQHGARPFMVQTCDNNDQASWWEWKVNPLNRKVQVNPDDLDEIQSAIDSADLLILQNGKFDEKGLRLLFQDHGRVLRWDWSKVRDTLIAGHLLASNQPHSLDVMAMVYLDVNIQPYEEALKQACTEARKIAKKSYPKWRIAKEGLPEMPSARGESKGNAAKGTTGTSPWKFDMWLPKLIAETEGYSADHPWYTVTQEYANADPVTTLHLWFRQEELIKERGLWNIYLERLKLLPVIAKMEWHGMTLSKSRTEELYKRLNEEANACHRICLQLADNKIESLPVNGASNDLKYVLFEKFKLESPKKTPTGAASTDKFVLDHWLATLPEKSKSWAFVSNLRKYRKRKTAIGYIDSYKKYWLPTSPKAVASDVRKVYSSLNPTGTDTLRCSSQYPNEQQISKQEEVNLRYCFGPADGREWWSLDYENLELRIPAYSSGEQVMIELFEKPDDPPYFGSYHLLNASIVYPDLFWPLAEQKGAFKKKYASTWYQWIKNMGFAISYGAIPESGTADRAAHKPGAHMLLVNKLKEHKKLSQRMIDLANKQGYVETIPDKAVDPSRGYPVLCSRSKWGKVSPTIPLSYHVQSTAMWCTMKAMIRVHHYFEELNRQSTLQYHMVMQVHDEIVVDLPAGGKANLSVIQHVQQLMEMSGEDIGVPLRASTSWHPNNWAEETKV